MPDTRTFVKSLVPDTLHAAQYSGTLLSVVTLKSLGKALRQIRVAKGLSIDLMPMDKANLSRLERGSRKGGYSHESLGALCDALGTPVSQVFALAEEIESGASTPDTVRLVRRVEALTEGPRKAVMTIIEAFSGTARRIRSGQYRGIDRRHGGDRRSIVRL